MFLYEVTLPRGRSNPNWMAFYENVSRLNAKPPDYAGINNVVLLKHHMDMKTVQMLCTEKFKSRGKQVEVVEITSKTLKSPPHGIYTDLVNDYFLRYDTFENIE